ncbi:uncharacterized protein ACMZJ9_010470 isoform 2-T3 [Mantella aurantiaca]
MVSKKYMVGIFSREHEDLYKWLIPILITFIAVRDVRPVVISNNFYNFQQEVAKCDFGILYHSKRRGRLNVTNVTDSLYDEELKYLSDTYGKKKVLVVIDDLEDSSDNAKYEILNSQNSIRELAEELFLFSTAEKAQLEDEVTSGYQSDLNNKLDHLKKIIDGKQGFSEISRHRPWIWVFIIAVISVAALLIIILPITLSH